MNDMGLSPSRSRPRAELLLAAEFGEDRAGAVRLHQARGGRARLPRLPHQLPLGW